MSGTNMHKEAETICSTPFITLSPSEEQVFQVGKMNLISIISVFVFISSASAKEDFALTDDNFDTKIRTSNFFVAFIKDR